MPSYDSGDTTGAGSSLPTAGVNVAEPRWPAMIAFLSVGGLYTALPTALSFGPRWLLLALVASVLVPTALAHRMGRDALNVALGHLLSAIMTGFMLLSLGLLIAALPTHKEAPLTLLRSAAALWVTNVLVFASWYWRLDAGGPHERDRVPGHTKGAFLFPQMVQQPGQNSAGELWSPQFIDYLFLAFNTSTALSPTDTPVLSRWAKVLGMVQSSISLTVIVILAARAINIM